MQPSPLADFRQIVETLPALDSAAGTTAREKFSSGTPNRLEELAVRLAAVQGKAAPAVRQPVVTVFAAAHGIAARGVSQQTASAVQKAVEAFGRGATALNGICTAGNLGLKVFELAPHLPTADFTAGPALDARGCAATVGFGMEAAAGGADVLVLTGLAAGGETSAAAVGAALAGERGGAEWVESGLPEHLRLRRVEAVEAGLHRHAGSLGDPLEVLARLGGRETAAIAGAIAAARVQRALVVLDGDAAAAAALVVHALWPDAVGHCVLGQRLNSAKLGQAAERAGLVPLLDLGLEAPGEAGAVAVGLVKAALAAVASAGTAA